MYISDEQFERVEYLLGFVNTIAEIVSDPELYMDPNCKTSTVFAIGVTEADDNLEFGTNESDDLEDFRENLAALESEVKSLVRVDYSDKWKEIQGVDDEN